MVDQKSDSVDWRMSWEGVRRAARPAGSSGRDVLDGFYAALEKASLKQVPLRMRNALQVSLGLEACWRPKTERQEVHPRSKAGLCCRLVFEMDALKSGASFLHLTSYGVGQSSTGKIDTAVWRRAKGRRHRS